MPATACYLLPDGFALVAETANPTTPPTDSGFPPELAAAPDAADPVFRTGSDRQEEEVL
jgi:hypothetical protein